MHVSWKLQAANAIMMRGLMAPLSQPLGLGFKPSSVASWAAGELAVIMAALPRKRQTLLFSATMTQGLVAMQQHALPQAHCFQARLLLLLDSMHARPDCDALLASDDTMSSLLCSRRLAMMLTKAACAGI